MIEKRLSVIRRPNGGYFVRHDPTKPCEELGDLHEVTSFINRLPQRVLQRKPLYEDVPHEEVERLEMYRQTFL